MSKKITDFTFLTEEQLFERRKLEILKDYGMKAAVTDFAILLGAYVSDNIYAGDSRDLQDRTGYWWSSSSAGAGDVRVVLNDGNRDYSIRLFRNCGARPASPFSVISDISPNVVRGRDGIPRITYGEYPQYATDRKTAKELERNFNSRITLGFGKTGKTYTTDSRKYSEYDKRFQAQTHIEYEYMGKKYVRVKANSYYDGNKFTLSNGEKYRDDDFVWIEVQPITWLVDEKSKTILSEKLIFSGIRYTDKDIPYRDDFKSTEIKKFMDDYFAKDIAPTRSLTQDIVDTDKQTPDTKPINTRKKNPYKFDFTNVSEEDIVKGAVESGVAVFLHGKSSEGKSARVRQLDPNLEIIYLRNASPDSLNGKSVYNSETGNMIDVPPTWYKKIKEQCDNEPDKIHIVFFDEITNALPAIQGMAYNIILDREVNGIWKLPQNCRVVAAGNDMNDSLAANQLAEPLFNRFAHVYIETGVEDWLKWAMTADNEHERLGYSGDKQEHKIHPSIFAYIAFKRESALRSKYTGEKPNADPRKWELASRMLYKTGKPEMLRALVGEDITREFTEFCNQQVITLQDVIEGKYSPRDLEMNISEKWATAVGLSYADEQNVEKVRDFVSKLNAGDIVAVFDSLWTHGDQKRMEKISELRLKEEERKAKGDEDR